MPVLAFVPTAETLELAITLARGSSLCVVESTDFPVGGWAARVGAINLLTGQSTNLDPRLVESIARLKFHGNNGYGPSFDRQCAQGVLDGLARDGLLDGDLVVGALAAEGVSVRGQHRIRQMIDKM